MQRLFKILRFFLIIIASVAIISVTAVTTVYFLVEPQLPSIKNPESYQLDIPLRVYSHDEQLMAEFGEMKREPLKYSAIPEPMVHAIIAAEDNRFFKHPGVDYVGILRAAINLIKTGKKGQGGSTITMQVARNFFLSREKTFIRKIKEIFLSFRLEHKFSKQQIIELYLNKIYLGHRSYGVATAAKVYYGKPISELSIAQFAMIAGLPKAPSKFNPITNNSRATSRRNYILDRMHELEFIDKETYIKAKNEKDIAKLHTPDIQLSAPYISEMVRAWITSHPEFGESAYTKGYKVYTSIDSKLQKAADLALRETLQEYEHRHGYKGIIKHIELKEIDTETLIDELNAISSPGHLQTAIVLEIVKEPKKTKKSVQNSYAKLLTSNGESIDLNWKNITWARKYLSDTSLGPKLKQISDVLSPGDVVYIAPFMTPETKKQKSKQDYRLAQIPEVSGALVSLRPQTGEIVALSGGFDFYLSKFNRITQAKRQPGSNFKPFIYSAALNKGYTPATLINDAPVVFKDNKLEGAWRPSNYSGKFFGPTRFRKALIKSRNMVSIRILMDIGVNYALDYVKNFSFDPQILPNNLSLALGSANLTPLEVINGYAIFANGGYQIKPWFIEKIMDKSGQIIFQEQPLVACSDYYPKTSCPEIKEQQAPQTVAKENVYIMTSVLKDVIQHGTGRKAKKLNRMDIAGKTGTTNDQFDAWFSGFNPDYATTAWVGFDTPRSLGRYETGGKAALPMWIKFMREALQNSPEKSVPIPDNIISVKIDKETGTLATKASKNTKFEIFIQGTEPEALPQNAIDEGALSSGKNVQEELF